MAHKSPSEVIQSSLVDLKPHLSCVVVCLFSKQVRVGSSFFCKVLGLWFVEVNSILVWM
jgi:hypothetical protein